MQIGVQAHLKVIALSFEFRTVVQRLVLQGFLNKSSSNQSSMLKPDMGRFNRIVGFFKPLFLDIPYDGHIQCRTLSDVKVLMSSRV